MQPTIEGLCARLHNESVHTEHVTALALKLFDRVRARLNIPAADRSLLDAAARLHDVGYSLDPLHHVEVSAQVILQEGIRGYRQTQLPLIAGVMLLHGGKLAELLRHPLWEELTEAQRRRVLPLGAFLRLADGLDYGHIQNTGITGVRFTEKTVEVRVASPLFTHNLTRADRKADLWRRVFPLGIKLVADRMTAPPLLALEVPPAEAARRLLSLHYKTILANIDGAIDGGDSEPLHRIRVATRRMRVLLQLFKKHLPGESPRFIDDALRELGGELGPARDLDVWIDFLRTNAARRPLASSRLWQPFLHYQLRRRYLQDATVRRSLRGAHFGGLRHHVARLLRAELPRLLETASRERGALGSLAAKKFSRALRRVRRQAHLRHSTSSAKLHKLRGTLRQARYVGEFFAPLLGPGEQRVTRRLHDAEQVLARIHDIDVALEEFLPEGLPAPRALTRQLVKRRQEALGDLARSWKRLGEL